MKIDIVIISVIVTVYFIKKQFEFEKISKIRYLTIPLFATVQFITAVQLENGQDVLLLIFGAVISFLIGWYQTTDFEIKQKNTIINYYVRVGSVEQSVYTKELYSKGGKSYLIGWIMIFIVQVFLSVIYHEIELDEIQSEWLAEIAKDLFIFLRVKEHSYWWVWELYSVSNLSYYFILRKKHKQMSKI